MSTYGQAKPNTPPKGHWEYNGEYVPIRDMPLEVVQAIVKERRTKGKYVHPLMLVRLGELPAEDPNKIRHTKSFRVGDSHDSN